MLNPSYSKADLWICMLIALLVGALVGFVPLAIQLSHSKNAWRVYQIDRVQEWAETEKQRIGAQ